VDSRRAQIGSAGPVARQSLTHRLDEALQLAFDWVVDNSRTVVAVLVGALIIGASAAGIYEWLQSRRMEAFDDLARVQRALDKALPLEASGFGTLDTANPEIARKAREEAVSGFDAVASQHSGSLPGTAAGLRAARLEIALGKLDAADARLEKLTTEVSGGVERAAVLRLRGYVLEETGRQEQAADLYAEVGAIEEYPGRIQSFVQAAETYERVGKLEPAIQALEALSAAAPEYAEQADILSQLETLRARQGREANRKPEAPKPAE
jgi:tetratricopeptide (TPR) repeat protein